MKSKTGIVIDLNVDRHEMEDCWDWLLLSIYSSYLFMKPLIGV